MVAKSLRSVQTSPGRELITASQWRVLEDTGREGLGATEEKMT